MQENDNHFCSHKITDDNVALDGNIALFPVNPFEFDERKGKG